MSRGDLGLPLFFAAQEGHADVVRSLIHAGASISSLGNLCPLHFAAQGNHADVVGELLEAGAGPDQQHKLGSTHTTALHVSAGLGRMGVVPELLNAGADVQVSAEDGRTPLFFSFQQGCADAVRLLAKAGADLGHLTNSGSTALNEAAKYGHDHVVRVLVEAGVYPDQRIFWGAGTKDLDDCLSVTATPLLTAAFKGHVLAVRELLMAGSTWDQV
ncbi:unnamed protein product, partial [Choristocarpus tenellus]